MKRRIKRPWQSENSGIALPPLQSLPRAGRASSPLGPQGCSEGTDDTDSNMRSISHVCTHGSCLTSGGADTGVGKNRAQQAAVSMCQIPTSAN